MSSQPAAMDDTSGSQVMEMLNLIRREQMEKFSSIETLLNEKIGNLEAKVDSLTEEVHDLKKLSHSQKEARPPKLETPKQLARKEKQKEEKSRQALKNKTETLLYPLLNGYFEWAKSKIALVDGNVNVQDNTFAGKNFSFTDFKEAIQNHPWTVFPKEFGHIIWATKGITSSNGKITTENGKKLDLIDFIDGVETKPFDYLNPENYEVECWYCRKTLDVASCIREDRVSVICDCRSMTALGLNKPGFEWIHFNDCKHLNQCKMWKKPMWCNCCSRNDNNFHNTPYDHRARNPTRKL